MSYIFVLKYNRGLHCFLFYRLLHWDVNNENLHGDFFERHTKDPDITQKMFQWIHSIDPSIKLFLNDYAVLPVSTMTTVRTHTLCLSQVNCWRCFRQILLKYVKCQLFFFQAIKNQAQNFIKNQVPIGNVGLQSHFYITDIDIDVLKVTSLSSCKYRTISDNQRQNAYIDLDNLLTMHLINPIFNLTWKN